MSHTERLPRIRTYLMCAPEHFTVEYAINPWMDVTVPVDPELALKQWHILRDTLTDLGHTVHALAPVPGLPDMVYAANGAFSVDGKVYGARFKHA
ncbi:MAG: amidinotransferase, partial [Actinobacteria bacterium]|nr:amidinotransferase [Actinomycetota bacterium]